MPEPQLTTNNIYNSPSQPLSPGGITDLNSLQDELIRTGAVNQGAIQSNAQQYFQPIVQPLVDEGATRFQQYFGGMANALNAPRGEMYASPQAMAAQTAAELGRLGGQYQSNLGMREYYGTRAEDLANAAIQANQNQVSNLQNMYNMTFNRLEADKSRAQEARSYEDLLAQQALENKMAQEQMQRSIFESDRDYNLRMRQYNAGSSGGGTAGGGWTPGGLEIDDGSAPSPTNTGLNYTPVPQTSNYTPVPQSTSNQILPRGTYTWQGKQYTY